MFCWRLLPITERERETSSPPPPRQGHHLHRLRRPRWRSTSEFVLGSKSARQQPLSSPCATAPPPLAVAPHFLRSREEVVISLRSPDISLHLWSPGLETSGEFAAGRAPVAASSAGLCCSPGGAGRRMRKRERENPCGVCLHYHKCEEGEVCGVCGHRPVGAQERVAAQPPGGAFPSEILKGFLYLGGYDNACRGELLKTLGISRILNTVPACQNLYKNSFTYYCLEDEKTLQFDDAVQFLEQCEKDKAHVLVHCMSGKSRSPAIVIAYLMKCRGWRLAQSLHWVKERRPLVDLSSAVYQQLLDYEQRIFGSNGPDHVQPFPSTGLLPSFGFQKPIGAAPLPTFNEKTSTSIFNRTCPDASSSEFVFRAGLMNEQRVSSTNTLGFNAAPGTEAPMDSC